MDDISLDELQVQFNQEIQALRVYVLCSVPGNRVGFERFTAAS